MPSIQEYPDSQTSPNWQTPPEGMIAGGTKDCTRTPANYIAPAIDTEISGRTNISELAGTTGRNERCSTSVSDASRSTLTDISHLAYATIPNAA
ncbi:hypothetical protein ACHAWU_004007 [Discostella pseudostelligera]|uniref:Uncharacterized protein n=1 Tax=Discostella pseudostelligera TaxID=259834 RepID=A0ABD3MJD8_9STRA